LRTDHHTSRSEKLCFLTQLVHFPSIFLRIQLELQYCCKYKTSGNSITSSNYDMTETFRVDAPPSRNGGEYVPVSILCISTQAVASYIHSLKLQFQYGNVEHGSSTNHAGVPFVAEPLSNLTTNVSHSFPGTSAGPSHQRVSPVWNISNCWVSYETQDELHFTIVFRKDSST
jgi:hypothetical protein